MIKVIAPDTEVVLLTCDRSSDFVCSDEDSGTGFEARKTINDWWNGKVMETNYKRKGGWERVTEDNGGRNKIIPITPFEFRSN